MRAGVRVGEGEWPARARRVATRERRCRLISLDNWAGARRAFDAAVATVAWVRNVRGLTVLGSCPRPGLLAAASRTDGVPICRHVLDGYTNRAGQTHGLS